ncbi:flippase [bacterium]|nr:flippase [bacterium]
MSGARIGTNSIILITAEAVRRGISLVIIFFIANNLPVHEFGVYRLATSFFVIFLTFANFGMSPLIVKLIAGGQHDESRLIGNIQSVKIGLFVVTFAASVGIARLLNYDADTYHAIVLMSIAMLPEVLQSTHVSRYDGNQRMELSGLIDIARTAFLLAGVLIAVFFKFGLFGILWAYVLHYLFGLVISEMVSARYLVRTRPRFDFSVWRMCLKEALPFLAIGIVWIIAFRVDMVMLSKLKDETSVGFYGAAYTIFEVLLVVPIMFTRALYPALARANVQGSDAEMLRKSMRIFFLAALPIGVGMAMVAPQVITLVLGEKYLPASFTVSILSSCLFVWFCTMGFSWSLTARGRLGVVLKANLAALLANVVANFILIPRFDYTGAAVATIFSEGVYFAIVVGPLHREVMTVDRRILHPGAIAATVAMGIAVWLTRDWALYVRIPLGALVYIAAAIASGALREPFIIAMLRNMRPSRKQEA